MASDGACSTTVAVGQSIGGWDLLATVVADGKRLAVFERRFDRWGQIADVNSAGVAATIRKAVGRLDQIHKTLPTYPADYEQAIIASRRDLLGDNVLAQGGDASFEACAAFLPDLTSCTFLSTERSPRIIAVAAHGSLGALPAQYGWKRLENVLFDPAEQLPGRWPTDTKRGILGGCLPAIDYGFFDDEAKVGWEEMALAAEDEDSAGPDVLVCPRIADACRASLVRAAITYEGPAPRYGVGHYAAGSFWPSARRIEPASKRALKNPSAVTHSRGSSALWPASTNLSQG